MPTRIVLSSLLLLAVTATAPAAEIERRVEARADGTVEISNLVGEVEVRGFDQNAVEIRGRTSGPEDNVFVESRGGSIEIEVEAPFGPASTSAELEIRVPARSRVRIVTLSADVEVGDLDGTIEIETVSGQVRVDGEPRRIDVETVSGDVEIRGEVPELRVATVSGELDLTAGREVEANGVSGRLRLRGGTVEHADLEMVSGEIEFSGVLAPGAELDATSHSGSIILNLPASTSARFEASTFSGRIRNELGPPARRKDPYTSEQELDFVLGEGDARVRLESFSGRIEIRRR